MNYITFFDAAQKPVAWWFPATGLFFVVLSLLLIVIDLTQRTHLHTARIPPRAKILAYFGFVFSVIWTAIAFTRIYSQYDACQHALQTQSYLVVEGRVENFYPS